jgi:hypothetical protein
LHVASCFTLRCTLICSALRCKHASTTLIDWQFMSALSVETVHCTRRYAPAVHTSPCPSPCTHHRAHHRAHITVPITVHTSPCPSPTRVQLGHAPTAWLCLPIAHGPLARRVLSRSVRITILQYIGHTLAESRPLARSVWITSLQYLGYSPHGPSRRQRDNSNCSLEQSAHLLWGFEGSADAGVRDRTVGRLCCGLGSAASGANAR